MNATLRGIAFSALMLGFAPTHAFPEVVMPDALEYAGAIAEDEEVRICEIVLTITNSIPPERVTFTAFAGYDKLENSVATGFLLGAASLSGPGEFELVTISSGAFNSETFDSPVDMDHEVYGDGMMMAATADREVATPFPEVGRRRRFLFVSFGRPTRQPGLDLQDRRRSAPRHPAVLRRVPRQFDPEDGVFAQHRLEAKRLPASTVIRK